MAPLNWGLGHATRCIPIIKALIENGFEPIIASDGVALEILKKEFPSLIFLELPSYQIEYAKNSAFFKWKLIINSPKMVEAIMNEKEIVKKWIKDYNIEGIISDNRLGVRSKKVFSIFITHQLNVLTGNTSWISSKLHQYVIKKYDECWVPDNENSQNLSGELGHLNDPHLRINYIGPLSRFSVLSLPLKYDLMILLSGPEPQRTLLENKLREEVKRFDGKVIFVCGKVELDQKITIENNVTFYNFMTSDGLEVALNESEKVLCRSGYTTIMDLAKLNKKAFFIPTPGQFEQEYLAKKFKREGIVPFAKQDKFKIEDLEEIELYRGLKDFKIFIDWKKLFLLLERK